MKKQLHPFTALLLGAAFLVIQELPAQTARKIVVEHFTNTRCSICASRNPGFYDNLAQQGDEVLHIAYHPSIPYPNCVLHLHNPSENNARTTFYNLLTGTPKLAIQGVALSASTNYADAAIFDPYENQTSPVMLEIAQTKFGQDSIRATVTVTTVAEHSYGELNLLVYAVEKLVNYAAPNGETQHHDVFRRSFDGIEGYTFTLPATVGESVSYTRTIPSDGDWTFSQMYTFVMLQEPGTKAMIQAEAASPNQNDPVSNLNETAELPLRLYPNPTSDLVQLSLPTDDLATARLTDARGALLRQWTFRRQSSCSLAEFPAGVYQLHLLTAEGQVTRKVVKR